MYISSITFSRVLQLLAAAVIAYNKINLSHSIDFLYARHILESNPTYGGS